MTDEQRIRGHCKCGEPVIKVLNSRVKTTRTDKTRYAYPDKVDSDRWCIFRCRKCHEPINEAFQPSSPPAATEGDVIEFENEDDGRWIAEVPSHPGALAYGTTKEEAQAKAESIASPSRPETATVLCIDCDRPYPHGLDMVLTEKQWLLIHPDDGGVLCPSCIVALRLENADYCAANRDLRHELASLRRSHESLVKALNEINARCRPVNWDEMDSDFADQTTAGIAAWKAADSALDEARKIG